ncbi:MAG: PEP-CTERM/exosortase system-associated acyltransferase [Xenococcaceae cyanobacterium MO_167.B27]|nr:PEP-CTERM/exosortase system-associated acyltransferase [Xenococcaceae cyanobacterium MO_167.B27]
MSISIAEHFFNYFSLSIADTPELQKEVYKIRYQVYCEELEYEPKEKFPDGMETDIYDSRSIHCLLKHKPSDRYIGCVRMVLCDLDQLNDKFPMENFCNHDIDLSGTARRRYAEISRLAVIGDFRKRKGEKTSSVGMVLSESNPNIAEQEKRRFPVIALSLYLACTSIVVTLKLDAAFTIMEARLSRHLRRCGIPSCLIGDFVNFHGKRGPFLVSPIEVLNSMDTEILALFNAIHSDLAVNTENHPLSIKYQKQILPINQLV